MSESQAYRAGYEYGKACGSWAVDGNTSAEAARAILRGYAEGDPLTMDMQPAPLSGEWADSPSPSSVLAELAGTAAWDAVFTDEEASEELDRYEAGFSDGYWEEVVRACRVIA